MAKQLELIPMTEWGFFTLPRPCVVAGPCSAESEEQILETARGLKEQGINVFRAGIWKPRTHPGCFEGIGVPGLKWLQKVKSEFGMKVCTEVASEKHVYECLKHGVDMVWIGARTTANPFLMQEIAEALSGSDIPVLVKNPVNADLDLWIGALERLNAQGIRKLGVIHRGFTSLHKIDYRNEPGWQVAVALRTTYPDLPFFCDPSHMGGSKKFLQEISQRSLDLGFEGLMIESHCNPSCALSDAKQQLLPEELGDLLVNKLVVRDADTDNYDYKRSIEQLRAKIDVFDDNLLYILAQRMEVSRQIGEYKKANNIAILQTARWDEILSKMVEKGAEQGLEAQFVTAFFTAIHDASVAAQNKILEE